MEWMQVETDREQGRKARVELSVVIVIRDPEKALPIQQLFSDYKLAVEQTGLSYEFIFILEGKHPTVYEELRRLKEQGERIKIAIFAKWYGEATALNGGYMLTTGEIILTLPAYHQIDPTTIPFLVDSLGQDDMVIVRRWPRQDSRLNRMQTRFFHFLLNKTLQVPFHDLTCSVRVMRRKVIESVHMYGDQHRFFPIMVSSYGFLVKEVEIPQAKSDAFPRYFSPGVYIRRLLDLLSIFFLVKFTAKPLRFFGLTGISVLFAGAGLTLYLVVQRIFGDIALADKPILLLGVMLIVLGVLLLAIGLIGELIIFTHARDTKEYTIERIVN